jgi:putative SOS response-associated peptidase YedK
VWSIRCEQDSAAGKGQGSVFKAESALKPRYNIAPTQMAPVIVSQNELVLKDMRWGLVPFSAKDEEIGNRMINARAETVKEKPKSVLIQESR